MEVKQKLLSRNEYYTWLQNCPKDLCPFCEFENHQIVLLKSSRWVWIACKAPYWGYHTILAPKRHITEFAELTPDELSDFFTLHRKISQLYKSADLRKEDGSPIDRFLTFWRERGSTFDPIIGAHKINHLHVHIVPEEEHLWDSTLDPSAPTISLEPLLKILNKTEATENKILNDYRIQNERP